MFFVLEVLDLWKAKQRLYRKFLYTMFPFSLLLTCFISFIEGYFTFLKIYPYKV